MVSAAAESATIRGLTPGQEYRFLLIARANGVADAKARRVSKVMPEPPPPPPPPPTLEPPTDVHVTGEYDAQSGKAIAHVSWRAAAVEPCTRGDYLLKYTCIDTDATRSVVVSAAAESATIRGLTPGQVYSFLLIARANGVVDTPAPSVPCAMPNRPSTQPSSVSELPTSEATGPPAREKLCPRARRADASSELEAVLVAVAAGVRQPTN